MCGDATRTPFAALLKIRRISALLTSGWLKEKMVNRGT
jgi:hypothetical protein